MGRRPTSRAGPSALSRARRRQPHPDHLRTGKKEEKPSDRYKKLVLEYSYRILDLNSKRFEVINSYFGQTNVKYKIYTVLIDGLNKVLENVKKKYKLCKYLEDNKVSYNTIDDLVLIS